MTRIAVLGAGVVGSVYAALLSEAGHAVTLVARGSRLAQLHEVGLRVNLDGQRITTPVAATGRLDHAEAEVLIVAVRGDQLADVVDVVAACPARWVLMFVNPLGLKSTVEQRVGRNRIVWCFSGVGGGIQDGLVTAHRVPQQPTVVESGQPGSSDATRLLAAADPRYQTEGDMTAWLDTHTVFVAAMAAVVLRGVPATGSGRWSSAGRLVRAMRAAFDALEARGTTISPGNLRQIFGLVPVPVATLYWAVQLRRPVVTVSIAPHARATRDTEQRAVAERALHLVGTRADRYRELVGPIA